MDLIRRYLKKSEPKKFFTKDFFIGMDNISIGEYTYGHPNILYYPAAQLKIGKFCSIAHGVNILLGGNHNKDWISTYPFSDLPDYFPEANHIEGHPSSKGDIKIGNDVWIGRNATIMSGVTIGDGAIVGMNTMVTKDIGPYEIFVGNPCKYVASRFDKETIEILLDVSWWDWPIEKIRKNSHHLCSIPDFSLLKKLKNE